MERYAIEGGKPNCDMKSGGDGPDALHNLSQEPRAVLKAATIAAFPGMSAEKFVSQVAMTMFEVHEIEAQFPGYEGRTMELFDDGLNFCVGDHGVVSRKIQPPIQNRMMIENSWLWPSMFIGTAVSSRIRQLQTD